MSREIVPQVRGDEHGQDGRPYGFKRLLGAVKEQVPVERLADDLGAGLSQNGHGLRGRCPVHGGESRDAFAAYPQEQRWHCFRCNDGGDVLDLYKKARSHYDNLAALTDLAGEYGVQAPPKSAHWHEWQAEKGRRHDELRRWRERRYQRRFYRLFAAESIAAIEDDAEREKEAREAWDELGGLARVWAARSVG